LRTRIDPRKSSIAFESKSRRLRRERSGLISTPRLGK
jgi:hypothetical protein